VKCSSYDDIARIYKEYINIHFDSDSMKNFLLRILTSCGISKECKILDIGCGFGNLLKVLCQHKFKKLYGIDISYGMIKLAKSMLRQRSVILKNEDFFLFDKNSKFDVAICTLDVVNHIVPDRIYSFFKRVKKILKYKGIFLFDINLYEYLSRLDNKRITIKDKDVIFNWSFNKKRNMININLAVKENKRCYIAHIDQYLYKES